MYCLKNPYTNKRYQGLSRSIAGIGYATYGASAISYVVSFIDVVYKFKAVGARIVLSKKSIYE